MIKCIIKVYVDLIRNLTWFVDDKLQNWANITKTNCISAVIGHIIKVEHKFDISEE